MEIGGKSIGIIYMAFGEQSARAVKHSVSTLRERGSEIPVAVVGTVPVKGTQFIQWIGHDPWFDREEDKSHRFFAGYVKPFLYDLSPFDYTLYIDADTEFRRNPIQSFNRLEQEDFLIYQAPEGMASIRIVFNKKLFNGFSLECAQDTLNDTHFANEPEPGVICSGIIFFKKTPGVKNLFEDWYTEWLKYFAWDEQLPLIRVMRLHEGKDVIVGRLTSLWNCNTEENRRQVIHHEWGKGAARDDHFPLEKIESIPGYIGEKDERELYRRAMAVPSSGHILELGSLLGRSAATLAFGAPYANILSVDNYHHSPNGLEKDFDFSPEGNEQRLADLGISNVVFMKSDSHDLIYHDNIDLLWIDCSHEYQDVKADLNKFGFLADTICLHDYRSEDTGKDTQPGVTKAVDEWLAEHPEFHIDHHVWSTVTLVRDGR